MGKFVSGPLCPARAPNASVSCYGDGRGGEQHRGPLWDGATCPPMGGLVWWPGAPLRHAQPWEGEFSLPALGATPLGFGARQQAGRWVLLGLPGRWHGVRLRINPGCQGKQGTLGRKYPFPHPGICLPQRAGPPRGGNGGTVLRPD